MNNKDAYKFEPEVVITEKGKPIGKYQIIRGAGNPEDPLYIMNVADAEGNMVATVMVTWSMSLLSRMGADGKPDIAKLERSIPLDYLKKAAPVFIHMRKAEFPDIAGAFADKLDLLSRFHPATPPHHLN